mgnify:CR=1 FL=1
MINRYYKRSRITEAKFRQLIRYFSMDFTASDVAKLTGLSRRSVTSIYVKLRHKICTWTQDSTPIQGVVEVDESYFGRRRMPGKRGRGATGKTVVFGIFKREGKVYTQIVPNAQKKTLQDIIRGKIDPQSVIHSDGWGGYNGLVDVGYDKHFRVEHQIDEFAIGNNHINGIESFWSYAKRRHQKFNGIRKDQFLFHLKESEFRFNHRNDNLYKVMLKRLRNDPI